MKELAPNDAPEPRVVEPPSLSLAKPTIIHCAFEGCPKTTAAPDKDDWSYVLGVGVTPDYYCQLHANALEALAMVSERTTLPQQFATVIMACSLAGISGTRLYDHLAKLDAGILVQVGGRTVVDLRRMLALMNAMPRGPRKANGGGKGGRR